MLVFQKTQILHHIFPFLLNSLFELLAFNEDGNLKMFFPGIDKDFSHNHNKEVHHNCGPYSAF